MIEGQIGYFELADWFLAEFTEQEQKYMVERFQPMGSASNSLISGKIDWSGSNRNQFLVSLLTWFRSPKDKSIFERIQIKLHEYTYSTEINAGETEFHPTWFVEDIKEMKRRGDYEAALSLLLRCIQWLEEKKEDYPWYYKQTAIVYRKLNQPDMAQHFEQIWEDILLSQYTGFTDKLKNDPILAKYYPNGAPIKKDLEGILRKRGLLNK